jgi:AraC-like DNA-binding protein
MKPDPLSDVLRVIRLSGAMFIRLRLSAPYSLDALDSDSLRNGFAPGSDHVLPFHLITQGPIWFNIADEQPVRLDEGDIIVLPRGSGHALSDQPGVESLPVSAYQSKIAGSPPMLVWDGPGPEARVLCGFFRCQGRLYNPLLDALPAVMVIRRDASRTPWLMAMLERTFDETLENRQGGAALVERLTSLLFMEVVQRYLDDNAADGWLAALSDPVVGKALRLMHDKPTHPWSVDELAKQAGVSRSVLADRFVEHVSMSPIRYLTGWRMELAAARLLETGDSLAEIAADVGYESESSFSRAFKRYVGQPPAAWRDAKRATPSASPV